MIAVIIFFAHFIFAVFAFCKSYQKDGVLQAFLNIAFIIILFSVGWTISDLITGLFITPNGYTTTSPSSNIIMFLLKSSGIYKPAGTNMIYLNPKDSVSLIILTISEIFFYKFLNIKTKKINY